MIADETSSMTLLWNDSSGWDEKGALRESIESALRASHVNLQVQRVEDGRKLQELSKSIVAAGADVLVAAGGDGTLNAAASALVNQKTALGIIPAGTLNHFARDLHIPIDPVEAAHTLLSCGVIEVDAAEVNGRVFINNSVLGLFPIYRSTREAWERRGFGKSAAGRFVAMLAGMLRVFWRLPHLDVQIATKDGVRRLRTPFVLIGNNEHQMQGFALGRRTSLSAGSLWVYVMRPCTRWRLIRFLAGLLLGQTSRESVFEILQTSRLRINSRRKRIGVGIDGEMVRMVTPLEYRILPKALRVISPLARSDEETIGS